MKRLFALVLLAATSTGVVGCSDSTGPFTALAGTWNRLDEVPGSSEQWNLAVVDTVVTGAGTWSGEACCGGKLTVDGFVSRDSLHVDVTMTTTFSDPALIFHEHFDGALQSPTLLVGRVTFSNGVAVSGGVARFKKTS
jgi:hypothetical protein